MSLIVQYRVNLSQGMSNLVRQNLKLQTSACMAAFDNIAECDGSEEWKLFEERLK